MLHSAADRTVRAAAVVVALVAGGASGQGFAGADANSYVSAEQDYVLHCMGCHQRDGSGLPPSVPDFRGRIGDFLAIPGGREYLIQVPGVAQAPLDDARLAALLNWMLAQFSDSAVPAGDATFDVAFVARHRRDGPADIDAMRVRVHGLLEERGDGE